MRHASLMLIVLFAAGCAAPRINTTRLESADLIAMTDRMVESLLTNPDVASHDPQSPWIIVLDRLTNRTNDIIPDREKWAFMARLRSQLNQSDALAGHNIHFVLSRDAAESLGEPHQRAVPTHALSATFYSVTVDNREIRSDAYLCAFQLIELPTDRVIWEDRYELKRAVVRNKMD